MPSQSVATLLLSAQPASQGAGTAVSTGVGVSPDVFAERLESLLHAAQARSCLGDAPPDQPASVREHGPDMAPAAGRRVMAVWRDAKQYREQQRGQTDPAAPAGAAVSTGQPVAPASPLLVSPIVGSAITAGDDGTDAVTAPRDVARECDTAASTTRAREATRHPVASAASSLTGCWLPSATDPASRDASQRIAPCLLINDAAQVACEPEPAGSLAAASQRISLRLVAAGSEPSVQPDGRPVAADHDSALPATLAAAAAAKTAGAKSADTQTDAVGKGGLEASPSPSLSAATEGTAAADVPGAVSAPESPQADSAIADRRSSSSTAEALGPRPQSRPSQRAGRNTSDFGPIGIGGGIDAGSDTPPSISGPTQPAAVSTVPPAFGTAHHAVPSMPPAADAQAAPVTDDAAAQLVPVLGRIARGDATQQITVRLAPPELGSVSIRVRRAPDGAIAVMLAAERPETLEALRRSQTQLDRALDGAGVTAHGRDITLHLAAPDATTPTESVAPDAGVRGGAPTAGIDNAWQGQPPGGGQDSHSHRHPAPPRTGEEILPASTGTVAASALTVSILRHDGIDITA